MTIQLLTSMQGTILFLSISLLRQIYEALEKKSSKNKHVYKDGDVVSLQVNEHTDEDFSVQHVPTDDIESLFYVMVWILILYDGLLGHERENFNFKLSMLSQWTEIAIENLKVARNSKIAFIGNPKPSKELSKHISPYFRDLLPLTEKW